MRAANDLHIAKAAAATSTRIIVIGEYQVHGIAGVVLPYRNLIMSLTASTVGIKVCNTPYLRTVQFKHSSGVFERVIFIKPDGLDLTLCCALVVKLENCVRCDVESLIRYAPGRSWSM